MTALLFYLGLAGLLTLEEAGVFLLPGDISLVGAGVYAARGGPSIVFSWVAAAVGMVVGSAILFHGVRRSRYSGHVLPERVSELIRRYGALGVGLARLVPGLRNATVFGAAAAKLPSSAFFSGLVPAAAVWSGTLLLLGWFGGTTITALMSTVTETPALKVLSIGLFVAGTLCIALRVRAVRAVSTEV